MTRRITLAILLLTLPLCCKAQWYLFPGSRRAREKDTVKTAEVIVKDTIKEQIVIKDTLVVEDILKVVLTLPIRSEKSPSPNFLDFYGGSLIAAKEYAADGKRISLHVIDSDNGFFLPDESIYEDADICIGPVQFNNIQRCLSTFPGKYFVSPLDPKSGELADVCKVIQIPTEWESQADEMVKWIGEEMKGKDKLVFLHNDRSEAGYMTSYMIAALNGASIPYSISTSAEEVSGTDGCLRFILSGEDSEFCESQVRAIALLAMRGTDVTLYSTAKLKSHTNIDVSSLHAVNTRITTNYHWDQNNLETRDFINSFMEKFRAQPTQFAFQGYDVTKFLLKLYAQYGREWAKKAAGWLHHGLQTDICLSVEGSGLVNVAVRRVIYNSDNTTSLQK